MRTDKGAYEVFIKLKVMYGPCLDVRVQWWKADCNLRTLIYPT